MFSQARTKLERVSNLHNYSFPVSLAIFSKHAALFDALLRYTRETGTLTLRFNTGRK